MRYPALYYKMRPLRLSVVIPSYNEEQNTKRGVLKNLYSYLRKQNYNFEVILVNDGSTDKTEQLLQKFSQTHPEVKLITIAHGGKLAAIREGINQARGEIVLFTDFDQSTPIREIEKVFDKFSRGAEIVIGNRWKNFHNWPALQILRSKAFNLLTQLVILPNITDTQCGFKAFKNDIAKILFNSLKVSKYTQKRGFMGAFDIEVLFLARKLGYKIESVYVYWEAFQSDRLTISEPLKMLRDIIKIRLFDLLGEYKDLK